MNKRTALLLALLTGGVAALSGCAFRGGPVGNAAVPQPAKPVALDAYLGTWHEYARYEAPFQKGCEAVTAVYSLRPDGLIGVVNSCRQGSVDAKLKRATGKARVVEGSDGAKLKVSFFGPFYGNYWVLDRGEPGPGGAYPWSIVGEPSGRFLWLLTREARPDPTTAARIEARAAELGYDVSRLRRTKH